MMVDTNLEEYLYEKIIPIIRSWDEKDIYAISFFVYSNEAYVYQGISNFPEFSVGYNTEADCNGADLYDEERWNFAFWRQNNEYIIESTEAKEGAEFLLNWYRSRGIENIGFEDFDADYDADMKYIGKGPVGYYELLCAVSNVAKRIQVEGIISDKFGHIPVLVHGLEHTWYFEEATRNANPNGEADAFLTYLNMLNANMLDILDIDPFDDAAEECDNGDAAEGENPELEALFDYVRSMEINSADDVHDVIDILMRNIFDDDELDDVMTAMHESVDALQKLQEEE